MPGGEKNGDGKGPGGKNRAGGRVGKRGKMPETSGRRASGAAGPPAPARERLLRAGPEGLADHELLALWIGLSPAASQGLLGRHGGLHGLLDRPGSHLLREAGLGPGRIARLQAARALLDRQALVALEEGPLLSCTASVRRFLRSRLARLRREVFACLFLDNRHRLLRYEVMFLGTVDRASVHPREVLRRALELNAAALILAHNHPSGIPEPSASDVALTREMSELLRQIEVRVLDHLVVGRGAEVSFAERGLLG